MTPQALSIFVRRGTRAARALHPAQKGLLREIAKTLLVRTRPITETTFGPASVRSTVASLRATTNRTLVFVPDPSCGSTCIGVRGTFLGK